MNNSLIYFSCIARRALGKLAKDEDGDVNIISIVILIGIAVLLAAVFKDQIGQLLTNLLSNITSGAEKAATEDI